MKGPSPGAHWDSHSYRQWEKDYREWYNKYCKEYDPHTPMHRRGSRDRDRDRDRMSPLHRGYSPQGRERRGPHFPPSSSSGSKTSTKVLKSKKVKRKKTGEEGESSHQSVDRGDATPVRDEPMDDIPPLSKTPPMSSKSSATAATKVPSSKSNAASKAPAKSLVKTDKTKKEKVVKAKVKAKPDGNKVKVEKVKKKPVEAGVVKKKEPSAATAKPLKAKTKSEDGSYPATLKKDKAKSTVTKPTLIRTPPQSTQSLPLPHLPLHDSHRSSHDGRGRREVPPGEGLLPLPHANRHPVHHRPLSPLDGHKRVVEESRSLLGPPPGKLRRIDGPGLGGDMSPHSHGSHQPQMQRVVSPSDRPGPLSVSVGREMGRGDGDRGSIRPLMDLQASYSYIIAK